SRLALVIRSPLNVPTSSSFLTPTTHSKPSSHGACSSTSIRCIALCANWFACSSPADDWPSSSPTAAPLITESNQLHDGYFQSSRSLNKLHSAPARGITLPAARCGPSL